MARVANPLVKRANTEVEFTEEQILELRKCSKDPVYLTKNYIKVQHPTQGAISLNFHDYQEEMIASFKEHRFVIVLASRQSGKTTAAAAYILWFAMFNFDKFVLIVSNKNTNAMEIMHRIRFAYENLPDWLKPGVTDAGWNKHSIEFDNGSRVVSRATTEDAGRTLSVSLLYADEFARIRPGIQDEFWTSMSPTLSTGGDCIITSTPNGDLDLFAQLWRGAQSGINGFTYQFVHWSQVPGRDEAWKQGEMGRIGERRFNQEHECQFLSSMALLIDTMVLQNLTAFIKKNQPIFNLREIKFWKQIQPNCIYIVGVDPATGTENNFSVIEVLEFPSMMQVAEYRSNVTSSAELYVILKNLLRYIEKKSASVYFSIENNGVGEGMIALYESDEAPPELAEFVHDEGKTRRGMTTTPKSKLKSCVKLKQAIESNTLHITSPFLLAELKAFVKQSGGYKAQRNSTDDCVSAMLIVMRILEEISSHEQDIHDVLFNIPQDEWSELEEEYDENNELHAPMPMVY
ncbi:MAG: terminase large subunit domain-containing protein [Nitrosopumilaceae archaeon]